MTKELHIIQDYSMDEPTHILIVRPHGASIHDVERMSDASWQRLVRFIGTNPLKCGLDEDGRFDRSFEQYNTHEDRDMPGVYWRDYVFAWDIELP